jgi:omega-amidase
MKIGVFQFRGSDSIFDNFNAIKRAIIQASHNKIRLLVFQECAACGYPPVETSTINSINFEALGECLQKVKELANEYKMYIVVGTIRKQNSSYYNSVQVIGPNGNLIGVYDKRALWGWDMENFKRGESIGIYQIDDVKVGFRICYEVRFPEYFRELFKENVELCFVSFCDVFKEESADRYDIIKAHLITRAVENVMTVVSVNSISHYQTAPTAVFNTNGSVVYEAPRNQENLLVFDYTAPIKGFGDKGRIHHSLELNNQNMV